MKAQLVNLIKIYYTLDLQRMVYLVAKVFSQLNCTEVKPGSILISRMPKPTGRAWLVTKQGRTNCTFL